jgi:hypothetical protein
MEPTLPMVKRRRVKRKRLSGEQVNVTAEAEYVTKRAQQRDGRVVTFGQLVFFSTGTGDAWILDPQDGLARCLARDGQPLPTGIIETADRFGIEWNASYRFEGEAMVVIDSTGRGRTIYGYPVAEIRRASARARRT